MAVKQLNPYLNFNGNAEQAIKHYEAALGAKADNVMRFGDAQGMVVPPGAKNRVMHARLHVGNGMFMVSDTPPDRPATAGSNAWVCLDFDDAADMKTKFDALAKGGNVTMPVQDTFWGATFGMLIDQFGIQWMFNCEKRKA
jgi:PhnB protein